MQTLSTPEKPVPFRVGQWLPSDQSVLENWLSKLIDETEKNPKPLLPVIQEFKDLIEADPQIFMLFHLMFTEVPRKPPYNKNPANGPQVRDYHHMLRLLNQIMTKAPEFNETGLVGFPINAIFDWSMGTTAGFAAFLNQTVNRHLKKVLNEWGIFLTSVHSRDVLNKDPLTGWFGTDAQQAMPGFDKEFKCDPELPYHGYKSWDDFFTREFRDGQRPVASPEDEAVIVNACESAPYRISTDTKKRDLFWIKAQPYSLEHMLAGDDLTEKFIGGTVYQAFLSALSYHRWHSPVSGTIVKAYTVDGTYYSEALSEGYDPSGPNDSQGYITELAARAIIFIEADNADIGLMCIMPVGMAEVSSCQITVYEGQHVIKGEQLGMFHFGGSTHCLFFGPHVNLGFDMHGQVPGLNSNNIPLNERIATVVKK